MVKILSSILISNLCLLSALGTELLSKSEPPAFIKLKIVKAEWGDFDGFNLKTSQGVHQYFQCFNNPFYNERISRLEYRNYYGVPMGWFTIQDDICLKIAEFLRATFEAIDEENPVWMELDTRNKIVSKVSLPALNPYFDGSEQKQVILKPSIVSN